MDETMPDASPLSQRFLASLANFMENEHGVLGEGDISSQVRVAIATQASSQKSDSKSAPGKASTTSRHNSKEHRHSDSAG